jgi:hypothetical protein
MSDQKDIAAQYDLPVAITDDKGPCTLSASQVPPCERTGYRVLPRPGVGNDWAGRRRAAGKRNSRRRCGKDITSLRFGLIKMQDMTIWSNIDAT